MLTARRHLLAALAGLAAAPALSFARNAAPPLLLAQVASPGIDPRPYLVSEKFDGVRALWDGRRLRFRSGRDVNAPAWFTARLPAVALDGEMWLARGRFDALSGIVRRTEPVDDEWRQVHYLVFELPQAGGPFSDRAARLRDIVARAPGSPLQAVAQRRIADESALRQALADVVRVGGEGLMLHRADAACTTGRSDVLLKLKPLADAEATVVGHVAGQGRYAGLLGALQVQMPTGRRFKLGTGFSDAQRREPPPIGSVVTYSYRDVTPNGVPRFASFLRVREDL
jgi:DNA ligase-1